MTTARDTMNVVRRESPWLLNTRLLSLSKAHWANLMRWLMSLSHIPDFERMLPWYWKSFTSSTSKSPMLMLISSRNRLRKYVRFVRIDFGDESRTTPEVDNGEETGGIVVCVLELHDAAFRCSSFGFQTRDVQPIADVNTGRVAWDLIEHHRHIDEEQSWSHNGALFQASGDMNWFGECILRTDTSCHAVMECDDEVGEVIG